MQIRIISLGEITTPNIQKTIKALIQLILDKKTGSLEAEISQQFSKFIKEKMSLVNDFKLGKLTEADFDAQFLAALETEFSVQLTVREFNVAWHAMHPKFSDYQEYLSEAIAYNQQEGQKIVFISFTNPKDILDLIYSLTDNNIDHKIEEDTLTEIAGIPLLTTFHLRKSKADLILLAIQRIKSSELTLGSSVTSAISATAAPVISSNYIHYVYGTKSIEDPILKEDFDKTSQSVIGKAESLFVETIVWKKHEKQSLTDALTQTQSVVKEVPVAML